MKPEDNEEVGTVAKNKREYTLKKPLRHRGKAKGEGDKVDLRQDQADRLKKSGHI